MDGYQLSAEQDIFERHNVDFFGLPSPDCLKVYVLLPDWWVCKEPSRLLLVSSPSIFAYYSDLMLRCSKADEAHFWRTAITKLAPSVRVDFVRCDPL